MALNLTPDQMVQAIRFLEWMSERDAADDAEVSQWLKRNRVDRRWHVVTELLDAGYLTEETRSGFSDMHGDFDIDLYAISDEGRKWARHQRRNYMPEEAIALAAKIDAFLEDIKDDVMVLNMRPPGGEPSLADQFGSVGRAVKTLTDLSARLEKVRSELSG